MARGLVSNPRLLAFPTLLLARAFPGERLFGSALVAGLQIKGVFLDVLDDVFLLHLSLETAQRALNGLAFLNLHFCQGPTPPSRSTVVPCGAEGASGNTLG
jgi:hypothetical protein